MALDGSHRRLWRCIHCVPQEILPLNILGSLLFSLRQDHSPRNSSHSLLIDWNRASLSDLESGGFEIDCFMLSDYSMLYWPKTFSTLMSCKWLVGPDRPPELLCGWRSWRYQKRHLFLQDALNHKIPSCSPSSLCTRLFSQLSRSCIAASHFSIFIRFPGRRTNKPWQPSDNIPH